MSKKTMKAVRMHQIGGPSVLLYEDAPVPTLRSGEVLVRVQAVGVNPPDWYLREGFSMLPPEWRPQLNMPIIPGSDISGVVAAIAEDVEAFRAGDEVYSMVGFPGAGAGGSKAYAEYVAVSALELAIKPVGISHLHAAGAPMALLTAWQFMIDSGHDVPNPIQLLKHEPIPLEGKHVLVNGAAGGVGHFALQIAKWKGARVTAIASGRHESMLHELGADDFIDYTKIAPEDVVRDADIVIDAVGGPQSGRFLRTLKRGGSLFPIFGLGFASAEEASALGVNVSTTQVRSSGAQLKELSHLLENGTIRVVIDSSFTLDKAREAHERAAQGHIQGKIVLTVA